MDSSQVIIDKVDGRKDFSFLKDEWESLLSRSTRPSIYSSYYYVKYAIEYCSESSSEIFLVTVRDKKINNCLIAIFPIGIWPEKKVKKGWVTLGHAASTNYSDVDKPYPVIDAGKEIKSWQAFEWFLRTEDVYWDSIVYGELIPQSYLYNQVKSIFPFPQYYVKTRPGPDSCIIDLSQTWDIFYKKHKNLRYKHRRMQKRFGENFRFEVCNDSSKIGHNLDLYIATEKLSWKSDYGVATMRDFYLDFLGAHPESVYFAFLYDGNNLVCAELSYTYLDTVYFAHGTYNLEYKKLSPGTISTSLFVQFFLNKGFRYGDFLAGYADYIEPWAEKIEETVSITVYNLKPAKLIHYGSIVTIKMMRKIFGAIKNFRQ